MHQKQTPTNKTLQRETSVVYSSYKISLCGDRDVGKTEIFRYVKNMDSATTQIEASNVDPGTVTLSYSLEGLGQNPVTVHLHDPSSGMTGRAITNSNYYRHCACVILVYDVTERDTLYETIKMYNDLDAKAVCTDAKYVIFRNKIDLKDQNGVIVLQQEQMDHIKDNAPSLIDKLFGTYDVSTEKNIGLSDFFKKDLIEVLKYAEPCKNNDTIMREALAENKNKCC